MNTERTTLTEKYATINQPLNVSRKPCYNREEDHNILLNLTIKIEDHTTGLPIYTA